MVAHDGEVVQVLWLEEDDRELHSRDLNLLPAFN
jgi:hypothetical protein